jgi:hypothetical protein
MAIGGDALRCHPSYRPRRAEKGLGCCKILCRAEAHINQIPIRINRSVEVLSLPLHFHVGLVDVPTSAHSPTTSLAQGRAEQ